ncbi:hypothetical protein [Streptomyces sp. NPDC002758]
MAATLTDTLPGACSAGGASLGSGTTVGAFEGFDPTPVMSGAGPNSPIAGLVNDPGLEVPGLHNGHHWR